MYGIHFQVSQYTFAMCSYRERKPDPTEMMQLDGFTVDYCEPQPGNAPLASTRGCHIIAAFFVLRYTVKSDNTSINNLNTVTYSRDIQSPIIPFSNKTCLR